MVQAASERAAAASPLTREEALQQAQEEGLVLRGGEGNGQGICEAHPNCQTHAAAERGTGKASARRTRTAKLMHVPPLAYHL